ncbi:MULTISPECIES: hypothetical protein [Hungatella]|uniref:hypothetical protein n=1 Tax=Hungatella TaxID=1649459 RepID=UPI001FA92BFB|nr:MULTISPECIES: hypothetical protein [Hungatella]
MGLRRRVFNGKGCLGSISIPIVAVRPDHSDRFAVEDNRTDGFFMITCFVIKQQ